MIRISGEPFDPGEELQSLARRTRGAGAIASFTGFVRQSTDGHEVGTLELQHLPRFTSRTVEAIGADACARFPLLGLTIIHRHGLLDPGEPIVFVAAAAEHRRAAFEAVDYLMDRLKTEAPFWKREHGPEGSRWIEARASDHSDRARWEEGGADARN